MHQQQNNNKTATMKTKFNLAIVVLTILLIGCTAKKEHVRSENSHRLTVYITIVGIAKFEIISTSKRNIFPVVDKYNILEGVVCLDDVREIMFRQEMYETTLMKDIMTIPPSYIDKKESIDSVMEAFQKSRAWNLPVLDNGYYVGFISKSRIYSTYRELLLEVSEE